MQRIKEYDPTILVIFITAYGDIEKAVKAIKSGATDFVLKPWQNEKLLATINTALRLRKSQVEAENLRLKQKELSSALDQPFIDFIGVSESMQKVFTTIQKVAKTDASVLILGENGTGKELVARALHRNSKRKDEVFISVDLGSINENLFESELFGHIRGAFTDAKKDRVGRFEIASGGTLFLDEIGNLSIQMQAKLLTALEKQQVIRVGSNKPVPIDVRMICATNMKIHALVKDNKFRQDLLYRINTVEIYLPPLRERIEDIPLLAEHFLINYAKKYNKNIKNIDDRAFQKLELYPWPGNVRELQHAIERAVILSDSPVLYADDFLLTNRTDEGKSICFGTYNLDDVEKSVIRQVVQKHRGNISNAAKELGITRTSLYRRLEKYDL
ncbi:MAG TPA: sigma-54-dependent Fis family transcriptional regulator [Candidatus Cloacimonetes bacterium]|nr:sigma-54-dependent Fis family transcriptional regulator [Candidatus Cloacimonadota bacterium]HEX37521.1 sigma-54-dependent Fis family transcriptional regulator [Candidatus Cloacimonadota bacterium]